MSINKHVINHRKQLMEVGGREINPAGKNGHKPDQSISEEGYPV
jgi:hypothetical protein